MKSDITLYLEKGIAEKSRLPHCSILISHKFQVSPLPKQGLAPEEQAPRHRSILIAKRLLCRELTRPIPPFLMVAQPYFPPLVLDRAIISEQQNV